MVPRPGNCCRKLLREDKTSMEPRKDDREFVSGVAEGFYGRPWTFEQRKELFFRLSSFGLHFYLYAPKDDIKHRTLWREIYTPEEMENLKTLIDSAKERNVVFIYALSPGLDMVFSSTKEVDILKKKMKQIADLGCEAFALLFDDIDPEIRPADKHAFDSFAHAQVSVTNQVYKFLKKPKYFLVCPTEYAASRAVPTVDKSPYLNTLGTQLDPNIDIMWTGPKVISKVITTHSIKVVSGVLRRKPIIWDNIHANDYDQRRLFLGPYSGRPIKLFNHLRGILTNPNCEFESNFIATHTLSTWIKCARKAFSPEEGDTNNTKQSGTLDRFSNAETRVEVSDTNTTATAETAKDSDSIEPMEAECVEENTNESKPVDNDNTAHEDTDAELKEPEKVDSSMETDTDTEAVPLMEHKEKQHLPEIRKTLGVSRAYVPEEALKLAVKEWLVEFSQPKSVTFHSYAKSGSFTVANTTAPVQSASPMSTETSVTTSAAAVKVSAAAAVACQTVAKPSPVKVAKEKSRNKMKKQVVSEESTKSASETTEETAGVNSNVGEEMEVVETKTTTGEQEDSTAPTTTTTSTSTHELPFRLTFEDLLLLVDFFYLPHQHGKRALQILNDFKWLKANSIKTDELPDDDDSAKKVTEWKRRAKKFHEYVENVSEMFIRLSDTPNRALLYDLYPYIWDVKEVVLLLDSFVNWLDSKTRRRKEKSFIPDDPEPWVIRGGICGEMQRLLPNLEGGSDLFTQGAPEVPTSSVYTIRPYITADKEELYEICLSTCDDGQDGHDLFPNEPDMAGDRFIGPHISICPETVFVIEDKFGLCGYGVAAADGRQFYKQHKEDWLPVMCSKYSKPTGEPVDFVYSEQVANGFHNPSIFLPDELYDKYPAHVRIDLLARAHSLGIGKRLLACILSVLKSEGCRGVYAEITSSDKDAVDFYSRLGFASIPLAEKPEDLVILGRTI